MKNIYHYMSGFKFKLIILFFFTTCLFSITKTYAQSVNVTINILPPYSPFYSDYAGPNASKVFLTIQNLSNTTKSIKLTGQLTGDNGIRISTKSSYVPLQPIVLGPNQVRQLNGTALKDIFDLNSLNVYGIDKVKLVQTSRLPEGNYTFCVQAVDITDNQVLSSSAPLGCSNISITYPDAPILISPAANNSIFATTPQSVVFNWINAGLAPIGTQYVLQVAEMPLGATNPNQVLNGVSFPLVNKTLSRFSYVLSPSDPPLVVGKNYAWRVKAIDPSGKVTFKNNGISLANVFTYASPQVYSNAPNLISPIANAKITATLPQNVNFSWDNGARVISSIKYNFQMVELINPSSDPSQAFNTANYFINKNIAQNSYNITNIDPLLITGKKYAWRVRAFDETGKTTFKNNGVSQVSVFEYNTLGAGEVLPLAPVITAPKIAETVNQLNDFSQPKININWTASNTPYAATYQIRIAKLIPGFDAQTAFDNNVQIVLSYFKTGKDFVLSPPALNENVNSAKDAGRIKLEEDADYAIQVIANSHGADGKDIRIENFGKSNIVQFKYKAAPKLPTTEAPTPITSTIAGKFFYRFKDENEQPNNRALGFPEVKVAQYFAQENGKTVIKYADLPNIDKFPDFFSNNTFIIGDNIHPLKNVKVSFRYVIFKANSKSPKNITQLDFIFKKYLENANVSVKVNGEQIKYNQTVFTTTLKEDGSFSSTFVNNLKLGYIGTENGVSYFGAIKPYIINDGRYYTSPDVLIVPKVGKTVTLPDDIVFVRTYNLNATIIADKTIKNQAVDPNKPISNYPVQLLDQPKYFGKYNDGSSKPTIVYDEEENPATKPWEANAENYVGQTLYNLDPNSPAKDLQIVDIVKTNAGGVAIFKNLLVTHTHLPYVAVNPFDGNLNYKPQFGELIKAGTANSGDEFSSDFKPETITTQLIIKPKLPEIYLRAVVIQAGVPKGVANANVNVVTYSLSKKLLSDEHFKTDGNGYLQLSDLKENLLRTITISKDGFALKTVAIQQDIKLGERFPAGVEQEMIAGGKIAGYIVNEKGEPISCNIKVGDGPYIKNTNGAFQIQNVQSGWKTVEIAPTVDNYYGEFLTPVIAANGDWTVITNAAGAKNGRIVLKEKLHRVRFKILSDEDGKPVRSDIGVGSNTLSYYINDPYSGLTDEIAFASPGAEFKVKIFANGYVTYDDYVEIPISKDPKTITIRLKKAQVFTGIVKDAITGAPIAGARVYTVNGTNADGEVQNSTTTGTDGKYILYGAVSPQAWISFAQYYMKLPVKVYAVKSGLPSYVRGELELSADNPKGDFSLTPLANRAEIWGLPIEVHSLNKVNYSTSVITGAFVKLPTNNTFKPEFSDAKLQFKQIAVKSSKNGFEPAVASIDVEATSLKVMAFDKFACEIITSDKENTFNKLSIKKTEDYGSLTGYLTSELSSFNFSYKYNGKFLVGNNININGGGGILNTPTKVFSAKPNYVTAEKYGLQSLYGKNSFAIHNFNAKMSSGSKLSAAGYKILADVNLNIPLLGTQSISAGTLNVTQNNIEWEQYSGNVSLPLESWKITGTGLLYDINKGGFKVLSGALVTDLPQVSLKDLIIMPTSVDLGLTKLSGKENLSLANVTPLKLVPDAKMTLNYDPAAPFDQKPHYRLNLSGPSKSVAYIDDLPGMGASKVNINMLSTYSDGKHKTIIVEPTKVNYYNIISQDVTGIDVANDFFTLVGNTNLEIPGAPSNVTGRFKYAKNPLDANADKNGNVLYIDKLQTDVEMEGKVKFEGTSYKISANELVVDGNVLIYKNSLNDAIKGIRGQLTKKPNDIRMNFSPNQKIAMGDKSISIISGGNVVQANKWSLVNFVGQPVMVKPGEADIFLPNQNQLDFIVNGAMVNNPDGKKIQLSGVETPFGALNITFDFDKAIFNGTLVLKSANIILGPVTVNDGTIDLQIDKNGFIVVGAVNNASITAPLPNFLKGGFKSGLAMGYYNAALPSHLTKKILNVTLYNQLPQSFNNGLIGFYVNVMKSLDKSMLPQLPGPNLKDIPLVGSFVPVFDFSAGIDIYTMVDFKSGVSIGGMAFANASCLYDLEVCTIGLSGGADGKFDLKFPGKTLEGTLLFGINANLSYCLGNLGVGAQLLLEKNGSGFTFKPSLK